MPEPICDVRALRRQARQAYSRVGLCCVLHLALAIALQLAAAVLLRPYAGRPWHLWAVLFGAQYLVAYPAVFLLLRLVPASPLPRRRAAPLALLKTVPACFAGMYLGNWVGLMLSGWLSGGTAENAVAALLAEGHPSILFTSVVLAPLFEEYLFRRLLMDRLARYGAGLAVLTSGLAFGLFHLNLFQFFYAFALGSLFAYIYLRTGRLRYPVLLHMLVNLCGGVIAPWATNRAQPLLDALAAGQPYPLEDAAALLSLLGPFYAYLVLLLGLTAAGCVMLWRGRRRFTLPAMPDQLPKGSGWAAFVNPGMLLFLGGCLGYTLWALV